ncbi:hypothetical protein NA57DRAFT_47196, partial [Rhizodiscina lignyota]
VYRVRRDALEKLAALSATKPNDRAGRSDIFKLCRKCPYSGGPTNGYSYGMQPRYSASSVPMTIAELETLLALCKAAPLVQSNEIAEQLLRQLVRYLPESYMQLISEAPGLKSFDPSPWEVLTFQLTSAVLMIASNFTYLRDDAIRAIHEYLFGWTRLAGSISADQFDGEEPSEERETALSTVITSTLSIVGFFEAAAKHAAVFTPEQRFEYTQLLRDTLSEQYMTALESVLSVTRNARGPHNPLRPWRKYLKHYAAMGRPLGAMLLRLGFVRFAVASISLHVAPTEELQGHYVLNTLLHREFTSNGFFHPQVDVPVDIFAEIALNEIELLEEGSDYLQLGSAWQQHLAFSVKANALVCFLCCTILDEEIADPDLLMSWLESTMANDVQISDETLASCVFRCMAILARFSPPMASTLGRSLPRIIVQGGLEATSAAVAADALATILKTLPQDTVITTLYSLGNILSSKSPQKNNFQYNYDGAVGGNNFEHHTTGSTLSLAPSDMDEPSSVYTIVVKTVTKIANACEDDKITALAVSMLIQKIGRVSLSVDAAIVTESAVLGATSAEADLRSLLKLYTKLAHDALAQDNHTILDAVLSARLHLSRSIKIGSGRFEPYLLSLLDDVVSKGDAHDNDSKHLADAELASLEIASLLRPLAVLIKENAPLGNLIEDIEIDALPNLQRDAWFNVVVHGFTPNSNLGRRWVHELQVLAKYSLPLIAEDRADQLESDIELNTVLRRGKSSDHTATQRSHLIAALPEISQQVQSLNYPEVVFLAAANMVETLRASAGDLTHVFTYFLDPQLRSGSMGHCMQAIATNAVKTYLARTLAGDKQSFSSPYVAQQLAAIFAACCHRTAQVQKAAILCADLIIAQVPSSLCQKTSLFTLLELLTLMWESCLERETDEYEWTSKYTSSRENVAIELSDNYAFRRQTLGTLHKWAKAWVLKTLDIAPLDVKGLLQTYLSEYDDEGTYGHISLGRSFAMEMGSTIPSTDQRLGAIESQQIPINTASDFIAQYTTRQEYRFVQGVNDDDQEWLRFQGETDPLMRSKLRLDKTMEDASVILADLESRTLRNQHVPIAEIREPLRRAGALLCRTNVDQCAIVHHLVGIPFAAFTKQSIKLGISLWMGVIKENPRMEPRILVELADNWQNTVRKRMGFFNRNVKHKDPFYIKEEFAPSSREVIMKRQHQAYDHIAPHFRLVQFLSSHFNATRLGSRQIQRVYYRLMHITLDAINDVMEHPLARETLFHIVLLGLRILQFGTDMDAADHWRLKDRILSAALSWFCMAPMWSFGGNRLQIKAETHLLTDVQNALKMVQTVGSRPLGSLPSLQQKQELLSMLLADEQTRLMVWLFPLDYHSKHHFTSGGHYGPNELALQSMVKPAWVENPALAVHLTQRFSSARLAHDVRWLLLNFPAKGLNIPDALELLLGPALPSDVSFQLKYLLFWAPVNPMAAVCYFLPAYGNHPFIIQYAMRALEYHSVDVTFFYVPQIVQTLRYDVLGYVERYIVETGKFSQLFAHQIIWNMKANSFKDEDSQIPDPVKPTLDKVMDSMIANFLESDRAFYEREFAFFNEVTDISGKLKPYIKKSKPEKKQKIEEELRKIKLEVGVYLPSNPDGEVIGIDRKSGKPLQSHAKAPYMATFRLRKERGEVEGIEDKLSDAQKAEKNTYEVWQSAIFKVGDDCRQDILALQMIAAFRGIFNNVGLDVYVYPYRVTATAPGCGVIDVLPNSISRDMLGREAVNGLYEYFVSKYGGEDSIRFQEARNNFVKSMAAYSVISYLLQFKDRHNGNIMIDDAGHILHIDFGFCFDIAPGGVKFERAPFKLTSEMVAVMGGSTDSQPYHWFEELCIKSFLASRMHCEHLAQIVTVMLDSGLPCFKPETMQHFRERFVLHKTEREAADFMRDLVRKSYNSYSTKGYDQFQLLTNGIPY